MLKLIENDVCALMNSILFNLIIVLFTKNQFFNLPYAQSHIYFTVHQVPFCIISRIETDTFGKELKVQIVHCSTIGVSVQCIEACA